jgi:transposase
MEGKVMAIVTAEIDPAKNLFAVHDVDALGKPKPMRPEVPRAK